MDIKPSQHPKCVCGLCVHTRMHVCVWPVQLCPRHSLTLFPLTLAGPHLCAPLPPCVRGPHCQHTRHLPRSFRSGPALLSACPATCPVTSQTPLRSPLLFWSSVPGSSSKLLVLSFALPHLCGPRGCPGHVTLCSLPGSLCCHFGNHCSSPAHPQSHGRRILGSALFPPCLGPTPCSAPVLRLLEPTANLK